MPQLPPGQAETKRLPIVGELTPVPTLTRENWRLSLEGEVGSPCTMTLADLLALPQRELTMDIHCVTGWSRFQTHFVGVPLADLLARAQPTSAARFVRLVAASSRQHDTSLPLEVARKDCWLVHRVEGEPLSTEHGGPVRTVTQGRYFYKSLKWVERIILLAEDQLGYWERTSAYHNNADPFQEERYDESRLTTPSETQQFRELRDFAGYRQEPVRVLLKANLANWTPKNKDLQGLQLKACTFDGADLRGVNFRGANLTLSKFFRADLSGADFTGADLEGADFSGAVLTDTRFVDVWLSATKFFTRRHNGSLLGPKDVAGMNLQRGKGLLEEQEQLLRERGIRNLP
jgi:DMSO/TMAO reductase YedYZ molybdopterin-dependent catalytic subunit